MKILKLLLYPFAAIYNLIMRFRNYLYDIGRSTSTKFDTTVVAVGNLNVGGSGKTPMVEYLVQLLKKDYAVVTLSRGYKRETRGYKLAKAADSARTLGDEPFQLQRKFGDEIKVVVGEDRRLAIPHILQEFPDTDVILLDDALQHRSVRPNITILVTDFSKPFYRDFVLPFGRLREARVGASRSDIVVVTKCDPELSVDERDQVTKEVRRYAGPRPVFFSSIEYSPSVPIGNPGSALSWSIILVSGIAKATSLTEFCLSNFKVLRHFDFPDHHQYTTAELTEIETFYQQQEKPVSIITTEKDMVKLIAPEFGHFLNSLPWFYMPIQQKFLQDGLKFDALVLAAMNSAPGTE